MQIGDTIEAQVLQAFQKARTTRIMPPRGSMWDPEPVNHVAATQDRRLASHQSLTKLQAESSRAPLSLHVESDRDLPSASKWRLLSHGSEPHRFFGSSNSSMDMWLALKKSYTSRFGRHGWKPLRITFLVTH